MNPPAEDFDEIDGVTASSDQARKLLDRPGSIEPISGGEEHQNVSSQQSGDSPTRANLRPPTELTAVGKISNLDLDMAGLSPVVERPLPFKQGARRLFIARHGERVSSIILLKNE